MTAIEALKLLFTNAESLLLLTFSFFLTKLNSIYLMIPSIMEKQFLSVTYCHYIIVMDSCRKDTFQCRAGNSDRSNKLMYIAFCAHTHNIQRYSCTWSAMLFVGWLKNASRVWSHPHIIWNVPNINSYGKKSRGHFYFALMVDASNIFWG